MKIRFINENIEAVSSDLFAVGIYEGTNNLEGIVGELNSKLDGAITELIDLGDVTGKLKETTILHTFGKLPSKKVLIVGLGKEEKFNQDLVREVAAKVVKVAIQTKSKSIASTIFGLNHPSIHEHHVTHSFAEGARLADYHFDGYALGKEKKFEIESIDLLINNPSDELIYGVECGSAYADGTNLARDLVNAPGNYMTPTHMAKKAIEIANKYGMEFEILEKDDMERLGMGGILSVAQGSVQPPKMIVLKYRGTDNWENVLGLVGKGLTFDTGGITLKPGENMGLMKTDMGGGAAVLGAMEAIGKLKPKVNVLAVVPSTENMPSGSAYKPGDVITTMSGKTIEIISTDAEGRLILADGITYAKKLGASRLIDVATLTGAAVIALGNVTTAAMTNNESFLADFLKSAKKAGEKVWQMPIFDEYKEQIKSPVADMKNTGGRPAGSITAALLLEAIAEETPWIHLDIAGTAWTDKETVAFPKGGTGIMVRSLVQIAKHYGKYGMK